jgi:site-specific DNA recombinase
MPPFVIYARKSTEAEDSQVQSLPNQEREMRAFAARLHISVVDAFQEAKSAKAPGRPIFNELLNRVERGEVRGILCWKLDRLARNPVDGGRIIWAIKQYGLTVKTPYQTFSRTDDNLILLYMEFGMAQKYVDDLSRNTEWGLRAKAEKGWYPTNARVGYLNSKVEERGNKTILRDPDRFDAIRRMWHLMLTGKYTAARIREIANMEWGFRTRQTKCRGGQPMSKATVYAIFNDPFYYGRFEYPKGSGRWYQGKHDPMITEAEFKRVQEILHRKTAPRPQKKIDLLYRGIIKCGECGSGITGECKVQIRCPKCRFKSSANRMDSCRNCGLAFRSMRGVKRRQYTYYHCTRKRNAHCRQRCVSEQVLEKQIASKIPAFQLPAELYAWGLKYLNILREHDLNDAKNIALEKQKVFKQCAARLENLVKLKTAPENANGSLLCCRSKGTSASFDEISTTGLCKA